MEETGQHSLLSPIAVFGLGVSGEAVVHRLQCLNIPFMAWDDREDIRKRMEKENISFQNFSETGFAGFKTIIPSAGIPPHNPLIIKAVDQGLSIASDVDVLFSVSHPFNRFVGITGTNGKSTTTALTAHILSFAVFPSSVGGNIGIPAAGLPPLPAQGTYVLELSSYQIEITHHTRFNCAVLLNITPDHIDWHGSMEAYCATKEKIFTQIPHGTKQTAIIGVDTPESAAIADRLELSPHHNVIRISTKTAQKNGIFVQGNIIIASKDNYNENIASINDFPTLKGEHNTQNIMAAFAIARSLGMDTSSIIKAIKKFPGLAHRQQIVASYNNTVFINDSKATNFDATEKALHSYTNLHLILGGKPKEGGIKGIEQYKDRIIHTYLIGQASDAFAEILTLAKIPFTLCDTMDIAVRTATDNALSGSHDNSVVMLSPACASFDQYKNFEQRGEHFIELVKATLAEKNS